MKKVKIIMVVFLLTLSLGFTAIAAAEAVKPPVVGAVVRFGYATEAAWPTSKERYKDKGWFNADGQIKISLVYTTAWTHAKDQGWVKPGQEKNFEILLSQLNPRIANQEALPEPEFLIVMRPLQIPDLREPAAVAAVQPAAAPETSITTASSVVVEEMEAEITSLQVKIAAMQGREKKSAEQVQELITLTRGLNKLKHDLADAKTAADEAASKANIAAQSADTAKTAADEAASKANIAAEDADKARDAANSAVHGVKAAAAGMQTQIIVLGVVGAVLLLFLVWRVFKHSGQIEGLANGQKALNKAQTKTDARVDRLVRQFSQYADYAMLPADFDAKVAALVEGQEPYVCEVECVEDGKKFLIHISRTGADEYFVAGIKDGSKTAKRNLRRAIGKAAKLDGRYLVGVAVPESSEVQDKAQSEAAQIAADLEEIKRTLEEEEA